MHEVRQEVRRGDPCIAVLFIQVVAQRQDGSSGPLVVGHGRDLFFFFLPADSVKEHWFRMRSSAAAIASRSLGMPASSFRDASSESRSGLAFGLSFRSVA